MAPISAGLKIDKKNNLAVNIETNIIKAQETGTEIRPGDTVYFPKDSNKDNAIGEINFVTGKGFGKNSIQLDFSFKFIGENNQYITITNVNTELIETKNSSVSYSEGFSMDNPSWILYEKNPEKKAVLCYAVEPNDNCDSSDNTEALKSGTDYQLKITLEYDLGSYDVNDGSNQGSESQPAVFYFINLKTFTEDYQSGDEQGQGGIVGEITTFQDKTDYFDCGHWYNPFSDLSCKIAAIIYTVLYVPIAALTWLAAKFLDFFVYYSTNDESYRATFVTNSWGAVRDIANIFFIIALLYVAIKTVLGLNVTNNKKLIGTVIIIALIINFSLFTTKVVIDGSNILAKIFYNNITSKNENGETLPAGDGGQKSISVGLVEKFDPQDIIKAKEFGNHEGLFIFITFLSIAIMLFMIYIFVSVALLFLGRVVSLWLSMIFSPIAFASYTVPFDIPGFGHKEWWKNLLENAFLAPIFVFFLYIIILFGASLKNIPYDVSATTEGVGGYLDAAMKTIIPFSIMFILLKKAKDLAVKYSGEIGAAIMTGAKMVGGLALGAATGGAALAGRVAIGGGGGWVAGQAAKGAEKFGLKRTAEKLKDVGDFAKKSSFDVRQTGLGKKFQSATGLDLSKGPRFTKSENLKGGWSEMQKRRDEKKQKRAEELKSRKEKESTKANNLHKDEETLQTVMNNVSEDFEEVDERIKKLTEEKSTVVTGSTRDKEIAEEIRDLRDYKKYISKGQLTDANNIMDLTDAGVNLKRVGRPKYSTIDEITTKDERGTIISINDLREKIATSKRKIQKDVRDGQRAYADTLDNKGFVRKIWGRIAGYNSPDDAAAYKIRMGVKLEDKKH